MEGRLDRRDRHAAARMLGCRRPTISSHLACWQVSAIVDFARSEAQSPILDSKFSKEEAFETSRTPISRYLSPLTTLTSALPHSTPTGGHPALVPNNFKIVRLSTIPSHRKIRFAFRTCLMISISRSHSSSPRYRFLPSLVSSPFAHYTQLFSPSQLLTNQLQHQDASTLSFLT